jgi:hypothetical protein
LHLAFQIDEPARPTVWQTWLATRLVDVADISFVGGSARAPKRRSLAEVLWNWLRRAGRLAKVNPWPASIPSADFPSSPTTPDIVVVLSADGRSEAFDDTVEVWTLVVGDWRVGSEWPIGHDEVECGEPVTELLLCCEHAPGKGRVIARGVYNTRQNGAQNEALLLGKVPLLIRQAIDARHRPQSRPVTVLPSARPARPKDALRRYALGIAKFQWRFRLEELQRRLGRRPGMWSLFFGRGDIATAPLDDLREARASTNDYWADPFLWRRQGRLYVFFEAYSYSVALGRIAVGELTEDGFELLGDVLAPPYHLSYPFLIDHEGDLLMVPESSAANRVEIWRCIDFPLRFERIATAFEGQQIADLTLFCRNGQWWAFCAMASDGVRDMNSELYAFAVDGPLLGEIVPHKRNPIVTDSRRSRPAGRIFERDGRWYRPSQNNSHGFYGYGLNLAEITKLSLDEFEEVHVRAIRPDFSSGLIGTHHLDICDDVFVIDGCQAIAGACWRSMRM